MTGKASKVTGAQQKSEMSGNGGGQQTATVAADFGDGQQSAAAAPRLSSVSQPLANSPCIAKEDLKEFVTLQIRAVTGVMALNPAQKEEPRRTAYKWPVKTLGSQVGPSLTKLTGQENIGGRQNACGSQFRLGDQRKKRS